MHRAPHDEDSANDDTLASADDQAVGEPTGPLSATCSSALARAKLAIAAAHGFDRAEVLRLLQASPEQLADPDARLPLLPALAFWEHLARELDDPGLPIAFAERIGAGDLGVLGFAAMTASSGHEALARAARYYGLIASATCSLHEQDDGDTLRVELVRHGERTLGVRLATEINVACLVRGMRVVIGVALTPYAVSFRHPAPRSLAAHRRFFGCPLHFGADYDGLVLPTSALAVTPRTADAAMGSFFEQYAERLLARVREAERVGDRVRAIVAQQLASGEPSMGAVARALGASERTLRRQLDEERTSFRELVDTVRRELALDYLGSRRANVTEVAYLLGFSEVSAFSRAFKRWYGTSPRAYRLAT